jgi:hypothetical protein
MRESAKDFEHINLKITPTELRYFISCGLALIQNVPETSLPTYCGLNKEEVIDISSRLREVADKLGVDM